MRAGWTALLEASIVGDGGGAHTEIVQLLVLDPRRIALISMPRLQVRFDFVGTLPAERQVFMRYIDLYMQHGGGWKADQLIG